MSMTRRTMLATGAAATGVLMSRQAGAAEFAPRPGPWRRFEITTRIELPATGGAAHLWVPVPAVTEPGWAEAGEVRWSGTAPQAELATDPTGAVRFVHAAWDGADVPRRLEVVAEAGARDRHADLDTPRSSVVLSAEERAHWTAPTDLIPTDGVVRDTALGIVDGARTDLEKARRLYDWIVRETARDPEVRGCGLGDVATMLETGDLTGKCADLNALLVGLARAAGLPARDVYGLRVAPSAFGYKSLGAGSADVTKAQHCRAEVFVDGHGWIAADPADVRKVMLEEPPGDLPLTDPKVAAARSGLFGGWEGNWVALNFAHDVRLPGARTGPYPFLMYPEAEIDGRRLDALDPATFSYTITARELAA